MAPTCWPQFLHHSRRFSEAIISANFALCFCLQRPAQSRTITRTSFLSPCPWVHAGSPSLQEPLPEITLILLSLTALEDLYPLKTCLSLVISTVHIQDTWQCLCTVETLVSQIWLYCKYYLLNKIILKFCFALDIQPKSFIHVDFMLWKAEEKNAHNSVISDISSLESKTA